MQRNTQCNWQKEEMTNIPIYKGALPMLIKDKRGNEMLELISV